MADPFLDDINQALSQPAPVTPPPPSAIPKDPFLADLHQALNPTPSPAVPASSPGYDPGREAARASTFGLSDKIAAAVTGAKSWLKGEGFEVPYEQSVAAANKEHEAFRSQAPVLSPIMDVMGTAGAMAPLMPGAAATLAGRIGQGVGIGAGAGAASGFGSSSDQPIRDTLTGAVTGGVTGGVLPPIAAAGVPLLKGLQNKLPWVFPSAVQQQATSAIAERIAQDQAAGGPGTGEMLSTLRQTPTKPLSLTDVGGENVQSLAGSVARQPGPARQTMRSLFSDRDVDAGDRLIQDIDGAIANGGSAYDAIQANLEARSQQARPLYEAMYDRHPVVASDRIQQFIGDPIMQQGLAQGVKLQRLEALAEGRTFNPNDYRIDYDLDGTPRFQATPNLRTLDAAKRGLDDMLAGDTYRNQYGQLTQMGRAVNGVRKSFVNEIDSQVPDYAAARAAWAGPSRANEMIKEGQSFLSMHPDEIQNTLSQLSPSDREWWQIGVADRLRSNVIDTALNADESKRLINSEGVKRRLRPMFDSDNTFNDFVNNVMAERTMKEMGPRIIGGSQTAARVAEDTSGHGGASVVGNLLGGVGALIAHEPAAAAGPLYRGTRAAAEWLQQPNPLVRGEIARMLSRTTLPENEQILQGITAPPQRSSLAPLSSGIAGGTAAQIYPGEVSRRPIEGLSP